MSNYANNMSPTATAGAHMGMGMPSYGMQPNAEISPWANNPPTYTSPAAYPHTMGYSPMHCGPMKPAPVYAAAAACGYSAGSILVLFILLVIISRAFL